MKKTILLSLVTFGLLVSCSPSSGQKKVTLKDISLSGDYQTQFTLGDDFNYDGLVVTAHYSDNSSKEVDPTSVSIPDMYSVGDQDVIVTYLTKEKTYTVTINSSIPPSDNDFPTPEVTSFLVSRGLEESDIHIPDTIKNINTVSTYFLVEDDDYPHIYVEMPYNETLYQSIIDELTTLSFDMSGDIYIDNDETIGLEIYKDESELVVSIYAYADLIEIPPEEEDGEVKTDEFVLYEIIGNERNSLQNLNPYTPTGHENFVFNFYANGGVTPKSDKDKKWKCVAIYEKNTFTVEAASSTYSLRKIELTVAGANGTLSSDSGTLTQTSEKLTWTGNVNKVTFTASAQFRFDLLHIEYFVPTVKPIPEGIKTISEIYEIAEDLVFTGRDGYLVNNDVTVEVNLKAIDAIDSVTSSGGLPPNAIGKVLCVDETGYILCSSGVSKNNPIDFYQRVKSYIKQGTTTYYVKGHLAKLNGVLEINVSEYEYISTLEFDYDLNDYVYDGVSDSASFMEHCKNIQINKDGYGVGSIVKLNNLTYFNKYNSAGSYYFLDQEGKLVPVYSLLDKDRSLMQEGKVYNIIGLESMYKGRPSLRILEVSSTLGVDPSSFDFSSSVSRDTTKYFYNVNRDNSLFADEFYNSVTTVYKMDVYVSSYAEDKYTFNDTATYDSVNKCYTTGNDQVGAARLYSLGIFNENLDHKQILLDFLVSQASTKEECEEYKLTLYFTLAFLDTVDSKKMWRVNIFEDLVFSLEYYESEVETITCNSDDSTWTHTDSSQIFTSGNLSVTNATTSIGQMAYSPLYLKVVDGTSLSISFNKQILGFTIYHVTYSYIAGLEGLDIKAYRQFKDRTVILLNEKAKQIDIDNFLVGGSRNNAYLRIDSIAVNYIEG